MIARIKSAGVKKKSKPKVVAVPEMLKKPDIVKTVASKMNTKTKKKAVPTRLVLEHS